MELKVLTSIANGLIMEGPVEYLGPCSHIENCVYLSKRVESENMEIHEANDYQKRICNMVPEACELEEREGSTWH